MSVSERAGLNDQGGQSALFDCGKCAVQFGYISAMPFD
jgi:hypothetical protein